MLPTEWELRQVINFYVAQVNNGIFIFPFTAQTHLHIVYCRFRQFDGDVGDNITPEEFIAKIQACGKEVKEVDGWYNKWGGRDILYSAKPVQA